jgi:hypothetical protein
MAAPRRANPRGARWTLEQKLHLALACVAIVGWTLVYMTLMRGIDRPEVARDAPERTAISANLPPG